MQFKFFVAALLSASAVLASPAANLERRQDLGDVITSAAGSVFDEATSRGASLLDEATSRAGDVGGEITRVAGEVFETVTSVGGQAVTVITSVGGEAITLAASGAGVATTKFGSVYNVATAAVVSGVTNNDDESGSNSVFQVQQTLAIGAATVVGSALLGAFMTL